MKIGISDMYLDALGGGEKYMLSLASYLSEQHAVDLFWNDPEILTAATRRFALDLTHITVVPPIFSSTISFFDRMKKTAEYDVIIHLSDGSIPVSMSRKTMLHIQHPLPWITSLSLVNRIKLSRISSIIYNSEFTKKFVDPLFKKKSIVLYPPAQMIGFGEKKENMILTVGRYNRLENGGDFKKLGIMIDMFKKLVDKQKVDWEFVLVVTYKDSDKNYIEQLREQAKGYNVSLKSNVTNEELIVLYRDAKIYWHAAGYGEDLVKNPNRAEHFGISVVEAMSAGAVPVVINAGGIPEIVKDKENGYLWKTQDELIEKTGVLIHSKDSLFSLSKAACNSAQRFSQEAFRKHVLSEII
jgi:glycosyltransferase involved in cell wall biosynthesis